MFEIAIGWLLADWIFGTKKEQPQVVYVYAGQPQPAQTIIQNVKVKRGFFGTIWFGFWSIIWFLTKMSLVLGLIVVVFNAYLASEKDSKQHSAPKHAVQYQYQMDE